MLTAALLIRQGLFYLKVNTSISWYFILSLFINNNKKNPLQIKCLRKAF